MRADHPLANEKPDKNLASEFFKDMCKYLLHRLDGAKDDIESAKEFNFIIGVMKGIEPTKR